MFSGVHNAMPLDVIFQSKNDDFLSASPRSIEAMSRATLSRVAIGDPYWRECVRELHVFRDPVFLTLVKLCSKVSYAQCSLRIIARPCIQ